MDLGQSLSALLRFSKGTGHKAFRKAFWHVKTAYTTLEDQAEHWACCTGCGRGFYLQVFTAEFFSNSDWSQKDFCL